MLPRSRILVGNPSFVQILNGSFTLTNESEIGLQYKISLLSEKSSVVQDIAGTNEIGKYYLNYQTCTNFNWEKYNV